MLTRNRRRFVLGMLLCLAQFVRPSFGQIGTTAVNGVVSDSSGAAIANATVTLLSEGQGFTRKAVTNDAGAYAFPDVNPGTYKITADGQGFKTQVASGLVLHVGLPLVQNFALPVGSTSEEVSVSASAPLLRLDGAEVGTVIEGKALTDIPLNGRNFLQLNLLSPGATRSKNSNTFDAVVIDPTQQSFNVNGQHGDYNVYLLDGTTIKEYQHGSNTFSPSVEAIQEFNVATSNYSAAFGAEAGAQVNLVTKSGTNRIHGTAFEFIRNNKLDAANYFQPDGKAPPFRRNQFGGTLGGPVSIPGIYHGKDKTFWFLSYQGFRQAKDVPLFGNFPTPSELQGDLSDIAAAGGKPVIDPVTGNPFPGNIIPQDRIPSTLLPFLQNGIGKGPWLPTPNSTLLPGLNYFKDGTTAYNSDQFIARIDQRLTDKTFLYGRFAYNHGDLTNPNLNPNYNTYQKNHTETIALHLSHTFTPGLLGEVTAGLSQFIQNEEATTINKYDITNSILQIKGLSTIPDSWGAPGWEPSGYSELGQGGSLPRLWKPTNFEVRPAMEWVHGKHQFRFGGEFMRFLSTFTEIIGPNGGFGYDGSFTNYSLGDFLLGIPNSTFFSPEPFNPRDRYSELGGYVQDDWRVTPSLTINLGLRYEWTGVPYSSNRTMANIFLPPDGSAPVLVVSKDAQGVTFQGVQHPLLTIAPYQTAESVGLPDSLVFSDKKNWGPRIGFAYSPNSLRNTAIRGGYGVFYQRDTENRFIDMALNPPFVSIRSFAFDHTNFQQFDWFNPAQQFDTSGVGLFGNAAQMRNARIQAYDLSVEHTFGATLLSAAYVGNTSNHLASLANPNQAMPGPGSFDSRRRWPGAGAVNLQGYEGIGNYNSLQVKAQKNFSKGLMLLVGYTWSKTLDDTGGTFVGEGDRGFTFENSYDHRHDYGLGGQDIRHRLVASYVYELPFGRGKQFLNQSKLADAVIGGWSLNGVTAWQSGSPVSIYQACNRANTDAGNARPDVIGDWRMSGGRSDAQKVAEFFNTDAFVNVCPDLSGPGPFSFSNTGRNFVIGPGLQNWDIGISKRFNLAGDNTWLQFRAEFFNIANHPNFGQPGNVAGTGSFGTIATTASDSRELQFGLKLNF
jgi:hypothetical protein